MKKFLLGALTVCVASLSLAQTVNLNDITTGYKQDFNGLINTGTAAISGNVFTGTGANLPGWIYGATGTAPSSLRAGDGASNTGSLYSFGTGTDSDRALGTVASGTPGNFGYGLRIVNNTGAGITHVNVTFDLEQWRDGSATAGALNQLNFSYKLLKTGSAFSQTDFATTTGAGSPFTPSVLGTGYSQANAYWDISNDGGTTYTGANAFSMTNGITMPTSNGSASALNGNLATNQKKIGINILLGTTAEVWAPGEELVLRFADINDTGNDHGFGIDNVTVVPEPATMMVLGIGAATMLRRRKKS